MEYMTNDAHYFGDVLMAVTLGVTQPDIVIL